MDQSQEALLFEVYIRGGHASGLTRQVGSGRRLVDALNAATETMFEIEAASLRLESDGVTRSTPTLALDKSAILIAIPHETPEQRRDRAFLNTGIDRSRPQARIDVLVPPFFIEGTAHLPPGAKQLRLFLKTFSQFFALTATTIHLPDGSRVEQPVVLVNRDGVVAVSLPSEASREKVTLLGA